MGSVCFLDERWGLYLPWSSLRNGYIIQWRFKGRSMPSLIYRKDLTLHHKIKSNGLLPMIRECFKLCYSHCFLLSLCYLVNANKDHNTLHAWHLFPFPFVASIWPTYEGVSAFEVVSTRLIQDRLYLSMSISCLFWDRGLLCIPGSSGTHHVDQADYRDLLISGLLSGGIKGMLNISDQCLWSYLPRPFAM